jgi:hypothetical protein
MGKANVRRIFDMVGKGHGIGSIARTLNREGVPTASKAKHWYDSYIYKILMNRACIGEFQPRILQIETVEQPGRVAHKVKRRSSAGGKGSGMETIKDIAQIIFYLSLSVSGPLAVYEYLKSRKTERQAQEFNVFNELDNRLFEYQKLALLHPDLNILEVPGINLTAKVERKQKQELIAHAMLFSLFERAYLMFRNQTALFKDQQWSGWKLFLDDLLHRESVQVAWQLSKHTFDTDFQSFMDGKIRAVAALGPAGPSPGQEGVSSRPKKGSG